jgi:hypothetical protein
MRKAYKSVFRKPEGKTLFGPAMPEMRPEAHVGLSSCESFVTLRRKAFTPLASGMQQAKPCPLLLVGYPLGSLIDSADGSCTFFRRISEILPD